MNAHHIKAVPGRKTDIKDAQWLAEMLRHGLVRGSFVPDRAQRELRELTRYRTSLIEERTDHIAYHLLARNTHDTDLGPDVFERRSLASIEQQLVRKLERLGNKVSIEKIA